MSEEKEQGRFGMFLALSMMWIHCYMLFELAEYVDELYHSWRTSTNPATIKFISHESKHRDVSCM